MGKTRRFDGEKKLKRLFKKARQNKIKKFPKFKDWGNQQEEKNFIEEDERV